MWWEKNCPDLPGGNLNAGTRPQQTPVFNCLHPSSQTSLEICFSLFFGRGRPRRVSLHFQCTHQSSKKPKVLHFRIKARVDFPVCRIRSRESLCDCCVALTPARFMVISRIDNIKYGGTGLSNQAAIHKSSSVHWSRC